METTPTTETFQVYMVVGHGIKKSLGDAKLLSALNGDAPVRRIEIDFDPEQADHLQD
jgi:hypothetical protein